MSWSWVPAWVVVLFAAVAGPLVGAAGYRLGSRRAGGQVPVDWRGRWKDRVLFAAALLAGSAVYAAVVVGSFNGLTAFARDRLGWGGAGGQGWRQYLVPVTLDGVAAAFAFLAGRAVLRRRSPVRCYLMVWSATGASAVANFTEGQGEHGTAAGVYLAFLSVAGIAIFHTFLDQLAHAGPAYVRRRYPPFGLRWVTAFPSTWCAALAWINYPPDGVDPTVPAALAHLDEVREAARLRRRDRRARREADRRDAIAARAERAALVERLRTEPAADTSAGTPDGPAGTPPAPSAVRGRTAGSGSTRVRTEGAAGELGRSGRPAGRSGRSVRPQARAGVAGPAATALRLDPLADPARGTEGGEARGRGRARLEQLLADRVPPGTVPLVDDGDRLPAEFSGLVGDLADQAGLTRKSAMKYARAWALRQHEQRRLWPVPGGGR